MLLLFFLLGSKPLCNCELLYLGLWGFLALFSLVTVFFFCWPIFIYVYIFFLLVYFGMGVSRVLHIFSPCWVYLVVF